MAFPSEVTYNRIVMADTYCVPMSAAGVLAAGTITKINTGGNVENADPSDTDFAGITFNAAAAAGDPVAVVVKGKASAVADGPIAFGQLIKPGSGGRISRFFGTGYNLAAAAVGTATSFDNASLVAGPLTIAQAGDVEADRGREIILVGIEDVTGDLLIETIALDDVDSSDPVTGTEDFATLIGVYTATGTVLGAQAVTIHDGDAAPNLIATLAGAASQVGAEVPSELEAHSCLLDMTGPAADATFVTLVGYTTDDPDTLTAERVELDAATPSKPSVAMSRFRRVERICTGEFTDAETVAVATIADIAGENIVSQVQGSATRGNVVALLL